MDSYNFSYIEKAMNLTIVNHAIYTQTLADNLENKSYGILVDVPINANLIKKLVFFLLTIARVKLIKRKVSKNNGLVKKCYAVYPTIEEPLVLYPLATNAERYANQQILPTLTGGINGFIRRIIMKIAKCHPSIAGVIVVVESE
jgi:hypothetical protein